MDVLNLAEGHRIGRGHGCGVLQVCDQKGQLAGVADGIQLLLLRIPSHVHQAMHQSLQLLHLTTLGLCLLLSSHQPANKAGDIVSAQWQFALLMTTLQGSSIYVILGPFL